MSRPRHLLLGLVHGYTPDIVRPCLESLRRVAPDTEVILAVGETTPETNRELTALGCQLLPYRYHNWQVGRRRIWPGNTRWAPMHRSYPRWIRAVPGLSPATQLRWRARTASHFVDPNTRRFLEFYLALQHRLPAYDRVALSDLRDVVFQTDPFALLPDGGFLHGLEDRRATIGNNWANSQWLTRVGGEARCAALADQRISCVGFVLGTGTVIAEYLRQMADTLTQPGINLANYHGADSGAHNLVVQGGKLPDMRHGDFDAGGLIHLHGFDPDLIRWTPDGLLADAAGRPFAVVHQYDRFPEVAARLFARLGLTPVGGPPSRRA